MTGQLDISVAWPGLKKRLERTGGDADAWEEAHDGLLRARLDDRYLEPIKRIRAEGRFQGEGFAILTIQCALIEFLAALRVGRNFSHGDHSGTNFTYGDSKDLYVQFLRKIPPFSEIFRTKSQAATFYTNVRCGLVHEAQTKNGWKVWAANASDVAVDFDERAVNRDLLGDAIDRYLVQYKNDLSRQEDLQAAFVRKFQYIFEHTKAADKRAPTRSAASLSRSANR